MSSETSSYGEIEIGLHRIQPEAYEVELRITDPGTEGEMAPARGQAHISLDDLQKLHYSPRDYGKTLTNQLFQDPRLHEFYGRYKAAFDSRGIMIRLRLLIGPSAPELHSLRWELLLDPDKLLLDPDYKQQLATSERIWFSR